MTFRNTLLLLAIHACMILPALAYDPLALPSGSLPAPADFTVNDENHHREIPIRVFLPLEKSPAPVVLFSHGLGGSREGSAYLGKQWAARGYVCVFLQHPGSDEAVWKNSTGQGWTALKGAASLRNFLLRVKDVPAVLDQLAEWNRDAQHALGKRMDLEHIGMSGHSFGAVTTQAISGQVTRTGASLADPRIKAAIAFSPSAPHSGADAAKAFGSVKIPWLLMTGTQDTSPIGDADAASRLAVFPALPTGGKYELVLDGAEHSAFGDRALPGDGRPRNPNHHLAIRALSTAFWDTYLKGDPAAKTWLDGESARSVLQKADTWQRK